MQRLQQEIERLTAGTLEARDRGLALQLFGELRAALTRGEVRAAEKQDGCWRTNVWVKQGILLGFRLGAVKSIECGPLTFVDKNTFPARRFRADEGIRVVPGGSSIREGAFIGAGVICMPPMFVNVGAYVDENTMIDSHALVGSCAQIGKRVHLSAAAQIGGVLEPVNASPVIVEDDVLIGGNCGIYEGTQVRARAVLASGVTLTRSTPLYDLVHERIYRANGDEPLVVPENAVVVPGTRAVGKPWAAEQGIALYTPVIVKYRDEKTDRSVALEEALR